MDTQPACLMRLGADGVVLAANNAAVALLGMESLDQALGMCFDTWVRPDQHERWIGFTTQVLLGGASSVEVDIITPLLGPRPTLLHGVPLLDHPDGIPSLMVAARAISAQRQLEAAIEVRQRELETELGTERATAERQLAEALADRQRLEAALEDLTNRHGALAEQHARAIEARDALVARHAQELCAAQNAPERSQLLATLEQRDATVRQLDAARVGAEATVQELRADKNQLDAAIRELEARQRELETEVGTERAAAERQQAEALADRQRLEAALEDLTNRHGALAEQHAQAIQAQDALVARHAQELCAAQNAPERSQLLATLEQRDATVRQLDAARVGAEATIQELRAGKNQLDAAIRELEARQRELETELGTERARIQQTIDALRQRHQAEREMWEAEARQRLTHLQKKEEGARQKAEALEERLDQALDDLRQSQLVLQQGEAAQRDLVARHAATAAERDRLARSVADQAVHLRALAAHERRQMVLASVGRVSCDIATHFHEHMQRLDVLTADVLRDCALDNPLRPWLERLRGEAIQSASLADELFLVGAWAREANGAVPPLTERTVNHS